MLQRGATFVGEYPLLPIRQAIAHAEAGAGECTWRVEDEAKAAAWARMRLSASGLDVQAQSLTGRALRAHIPIRRVQRGPVTDRAADCPQCGREVLSVILGDEQIGCKACLKLRPSMAFRQDPYSIDPELARVKETVRHGRRPGTWTRKYQASLEQLEQRDRSKGIPAGLNELSRRVFGPEWIGDRQEGDGDLRRPTAARYLEAFPTLSAIDARKAAKAGKSVAVWLDHTDVPLGGAEVTLEPDSMSVRYAIHRNRWLPAADGSVTFRIIWTGSEENNQRPLLCCPRCDHKRTSLVLTEEGWGCRVCFKLPYRSSIIAQRIRWAEKYVDLRAELQALEARNARPKFLESKGREVALARKQAGPKPHRVASGEHLLRIRCVWSAEPFDNEGFYDVW